MVRAITVRQPWAWQIIHEGKDVENRTRNLAGSYRGPVLIHAAKQADDLALYRLPMHPPAHVTEPRQFWYGVVLGMVDLVGVHSTEDCGQDHEGKAQPMCSQWAQEDPAREIYHLELANPRPLRRIAATGKLGLWKPSLVLQAKLGL